MNGYENLQIESVRNVSINLQEHDQQREYLSLVKTMIAKPIDIFDC